MSQSFPRSAGIWSVGTYLPPIIRTNDHWGPDVLAAWARKKAPGHGAQREEPVDTEGARRTMAEMETLKGDIFQGAVERRVIPDDMSAADMEQKAAEQAMARAGVSPGDIDFIMSVQFCPDDLQIIPAARLQHRLGLSPHTMSVTVDAVCNSFQSQLNLAAGLIATGQYRCGLLVQSSSATRLLETHDTFTPFFGDGATAVVVGEVQPGYGLLSSVHRSDGALADGMVTGVPGKHWHDEGKVRAYVRDGLQTRTVFLSLLDYAKEVVPAAVAQAGLGLEDVTFYASHQATSWLRRGSQAYIGLEHAKTVDTFPFTATLSAANLPMVMATALSEGLLEDGDVVAMFSGGTGISYSGSVLRWGR